MTNEQAVRDLFQRCTEAWGDADSYGQAFTDAATYVTFFGGCFNGRTEIVEGHRALFDGVLAGSHLDARIVSIEEVAPGVAVVVSTGGVAKEGRRSASKRARSVQTWVAVDDGGTWRFAAFQNTRHRPAVERFSNALAARMVPKDKRPAA